MSQSHFEKTSRDFKRWFLEKHHPHSVLNKTVFVHDLLKFIGLTLVFLILYNNVDRINQINLWIIKLGSVMLLVSLFFVLKKAWQLGINLKYWVRGFNNGTKMLIGVAIVLLLVLVFVNQTKVIDSVASSYEEIDMNRLFPLNVGANFSLPKIGNLAKSLNACPQINVPITLYSYQGFGDDVGSIKTRSYDGWTIKGSATCRKGSKEGENLNKYYCGGFTYILGVGTVNAYVEKTDVSKDGSIGKTYKHIIWNIYDENKNFVETRCLGDPDKFEEQQVQDFINELRRWG